MISIIVILLIAGGWALSGVASGIATCYFTDDKMTFGDVIHCSIFGPAVLVIVLWGAISDGIDSKRVAFDFRKKEDGSVSGDTKES